MGKQRLTEVDTDLYNLIDSRAEEMMGYISGLREVIEVLEEGSPSQIMVKAREMLQLVGINTSRLELSTADKMIEGQKWLIITAQGKNKALPWDDMSSEIRKNCFGLKEIIERAGGRFLYEAAPGKGTKIVVMFPYNALKID